MAISEEIQAQYDTIVAPVPTVTCQRQCFGTACTKQDGDPCAPVVCTPLEMAMLNYSGPAPGATQCVFLVNGLCSVYSTRPVVCRIWGAATNWACPHGCEVSGTPLTPEQEKAIRADVKTLSDRWQAGGGNG